MPLYDYHCVECDELFEAIRPVARRDEPASCPVCDNTSHVFLVMTIDCD
jgi:putative FmdB family regulatory protein